MLFRYQNGSRGRDGELARLLHPEENGHNDTIDAVLCRPKTARQDDARKVTKGKKTASTEEVLHCATRNEAAGRNWSSLGKQASHFIIRSNILVLPRRLLLCVR